MMSPDRKTFSYFWNLFNETRPQLEEVLRRYEIPPGAAGPLVEETVLEMIYKGERVEDPVPWLVSRIRTKCRKYWVARRRLFFETIDRAFPVH
jgi:hypothetical protein